MRGKFFKSTIINFIFNLIFSLSLTRMAMTRHTILAFKVCLFRNKYDDDFLIYFFSFLFLQSLSNTTLPACMRCVNTTSTRSIHIKSSRILFLFIFILFLFSSQSMHRPDEASAIYKELIRVHPAYTACAYSFSFFFLS